ncbi:MAG: ABC transporter permease [bacterium]|nr:ABC transporter permease [bacterium]
MIYDLRLAWQSVRARPVQSLIPMCVVGLAVALSIAVLALGDGVRRGISQAADPFGVLVIGPKGDGQQLVLNTILLQGLPLGTIPASVYDSLAADARVRLAVPLAKADQIGGAPVIGTNRAFLELRTSVNAPPAFQVTQGAWFESDFELVLGSRAAESLGLNIGDAVRTAHGLGAVLDSDLHDDVYRVVGILAPSGTPYDAAVYTTVESIWHVHEAEAADSAPDSANALREQLAALEAPDMTDRLTAVLVQPIGFTEQNLIWQEFYTGTLAQAAFPGQELGGLFDLLRQGERILTTVGYLVLAIAGLTVFLALYGATLSREKEIAIMRSLGGGRLNVFRMIVFEALALTLFGALIGRIIGYGTALVIAAVYADQSAIPIPIRYLADLEPLLWLLPIGVGVIAGLLPAALAYRVDVVEKLTSA